MSHQQRAADIAFDLMSIESTSGNEKAVIDFTSAYLSTRGWTVTLIPVNKGRSCVLATTGAGIDVTLSTHLDTVPAFIPPRRENGVLYGRGACDAKGIAAAMILAAERLRANGIAVALLFVVGEETCHDGAHAANAYPNTSRILINGEPTESTLAIGTKGALRVILRTRGRAAHSAYPHLGHSATRDLVLLLAELDSIEWPSDPVFGPTTMNIGILSGGVADNVIAPVAEARLMFRLVTPKEEIIEIVRARIGDRAEVEPGITVPRVHLGTVDGFPTSVAAFATDIPALTNWGTPYLFGPGSIHVAHTPDEFVREDELDAAVDAYERIALAALARLNSPVPATA